MSVPSRALSLVLMLLLMPGLHAEEAYIIDRLLVGLHKDPALDSDIIKVIPTGTRVEVLKRSGELALVRDPKGRQGWMDAGYLIKNKPAALVLKDLEQEIARLKSELKTARVKSLRPPPPQASQLQGLQAEIRDLQTQLASERLKVGELNARLGRTPATGEAADPALRQRLSMLEKDNRELHQRLQEALHGPAMAERLAAGLPGAVSGDWRIQAGIAGALLLLAFLAGLYTMDWLSRRRHGGFRI